MDWICLDDGWYFILRRRFGGWIFIPCDDHLLRLYGSGIILLYRMLSNGKYLTYGSRYDTYCVTIRMLWRRHLSLGDKSE